MTTKSTSLIAQGALEKKANSLLALEKITPKDLAEFCLPERRQLEQTATRLLNELTGTERDRFLEKIDQIVPAEIKNSFWEYNHSVISEAISAYMGEYGVMPTRTVIAQKTGISRQTVAKHFKEYTMHPEFKTDTEQFQFMTHTVLAKIFKQANSGDMRAARLYLEMAGGINKGNGSTVVNQQKNYIQINDTILSQENLKQLSAEQLAQIESIVMNSECKMIS